MNLKDTAGQIQGHFKLTAIKSDGTEEVYEEKNLIMDRARSTMAKLAGGYYAGSPITKIIFGTKGYNPDTNNILEPIQVGTFGFDTPRTELFSVEQDEFFYTISFNPENPVGPDLETNSDGNGSTVQWVKSGDNATLECYGVGNKKTESQGSAGAEDAACPIKIQIFDRTVKYTITLPELAGNGPSSNGTVAYTEASLVSNNDIFSMKTLTPRVKESTVRFVVEWSILF